MTIISNKPKETVFIKITANQAHRILIIPNLNTKNSSTMTFKFING